MATISLKINIIDSSMVKTIMFDPTTTIYDACRMIRDRLAEPISNCVYLVSVVTNMLTCLLSYLLREIITVGLSML